MDNNSNLIEEINQRIDYARKVYSKFDDGDFCFEDYVSNIVKMSESIGYKDGIDCGPILYSLRNMAYGNYEKGYEVLMKFEKEVAIDELSSKNKMKYYASHFQYWTNFKADYEKSIEYAKLEMEEAEKIGDMGEVMRIKLNIGGLSANLGFYDTAELFYKETVEYCESTNNFRVLAYGYSNLGEVYYNTNNIELGKKFYEKARALAIREKEVVIRCESAIGLARINSDEGRYKEALERLNEVLQYEQFLGDILREIQVVQQIIKVYKLTNRYQVALDEINKFEPKIEKIEDTITVMNFYKEKAEICEKLNKLDLAYKALKKYIAIYKTENHQESEHVMNELIHTEYNKNLDRLETIAKVGRELTLLTDIDQVLLDVKSELSKVLEVDSIGIGEVADNEISYTHFFSENEKAPLSSRSLDDKRSLATWCIKNKKQVIINDFVEEHTLYIEKIDMKKFRTDDDPEKICSLMYAPLTVGDEVFGVFTIQSKRKGAYTSIEVKIFSIIADYVAIAVKNASQKLALEKLSVRDNLTEMYNRRGFTEFFKQKVMLEDSAYKSVAIIMLDLDYFKKVNDTYGHGAGDLVLSFVGKVLMRKEADDIRAARLGGEEFGLIIINREIQFVEKLANNIRKDVEDLVIDEDGCRIKVTTSIGVTYRVYDEEINYNQLYFEADKALYKAKESGRNQVQLYCDKD